MTDILKVGLILPGTEVQAWVAKTIEHLGELNEIKLTGIIFLPTENKNGKITDLHLKIDKRIFHPSPDAWKKTNIQELIKDIRVVEPESTIPFSRFDILINLSNSKYPDGFLKFSKYGVWTPFDGNARLFNQSTFGWRELANNLPVSTSAVEIVREEQPTVLSHEAALYVDDQSITRNQAFMLWKASANLADAVKLLATIGETEFFAKTKPVTIKAGLNTKLSAFQSIFLLIKQITYSFVKKIRRRFVFDQWSVLLKPGQHITPLTWDGFKHIIPPKDRIWADPFLMEREGQTYLFIEEMLFKTHRGTINYLKLDKEGNILENQVVLSRPYHLSYPFTFEHRGELYMIPETGGNQAIELYRCTRFPDQWEFQKTIMGDIRAVDTTLVEHAGRWWLFVTIAAENNTTWDTLHLFYADDPLTDTWTPHPLNPVSLDVRNARMAGRIFRHDGGLVRPSQDSSHRYGYALNFNRITTLTPTEYAETRIDRLEPPAGTNIIAVHTFNYSQNWTALDMTVQRRK
ncbi:MAG: hypothetical protein U0Z26_01750 [Anaerolineales bacterium]